ncbi:ABC transporter permease [Desulfuromonas acetexigens]|uniref:ABC transporter permease n=1 Tax=Trichloromonas acetexigens TaxID=38815 RepID=A0A550JDC7_9BACT|nr:FtsX-like permease family protein [Desulfuromonas acetexigens]TRO81206.1 ABC transporter permease [Desulfuromonas acetexigens]
MDLLSLAWKNLWRNRRRTLITLSALGLSLFLLQTFHNLSFGVYAQMVDSGVRAGSGHIALYRGDYAQSRDEQLSFAEAGLSAALAREPGVRAALPRVYLPGLAQSSRESRGILLMGIDPAAEAEVNPFWKNLPEEERIADPEGREALVGSRLLKELKLDIGNKFVVTVQHRDGELTSELLRVRGVLRTGLKEIDGSMVMVGRQRAAAMAGIPGEIHELAVILERAGDQSPLLPKLAALAEKYPQVRAVPWEVAMPNLSDAIRLDYAGQKFIFAVILLIVTIGVVNTLLMTVMERIREFGVLLAIGATPGRLRLMIWHEALLLGLLAMVLGTLLGAAATWYLVEQGLDLRTLLPAGLEFGGVVFDPVLRAAWDLPWMARMGLYVVGLCLLASIYPAIKAARIPPAEAMRHR